MPFYDYQCPHCGHELFDVKRKITENVSEEECPVCFETMKQVIRTTGFNLKGSGWYKSGYSPVNEKKKDDKENNEKNNKE